MAIIDVTTFNGEYDIWEIRYNILKDYVDEFIVVESTETFSGKPKPLYFEKIKHKYPKVTYVINEGEYTPEEIKQAEDSPNTKGAAHWKLEFMQKERIKLAISHLKDDDTVFISDVDEIWDIHSEIKLDTKLKLKVFTYYLNNYSSEDFWGTIIFEYKNIANKCLNHLRTETKRSKESHGWHFTSMGGAKEVKRKLTDSYTSDSYATDYVLNNLEDNIKNRKDFLGRDFTYTVDESEWPQYLKDNREKYKHLLI